MSSLRPATPDLMAGAIGPGDSKPERGARRGKVLAVSRRNLATLVQTAQECGLERYEIVFESADRVRLSVGAVAVPGELGSEVNDFEREFG